MWGALPLPAVHQVVSLSTFNFSCYSNLKKVNRNFNAHPPPTYTHIQEKTSKYHLSGDAKMDNVMIASTYLEKNVFKSLSVLSIPSVIVDVLTSEDWGRLLPWVFCVTKSVMLKNGTHFVYIFTYPVVFLIGP